MEDIRLTREVMKRLNLINEQASRLVMLYKQYPSLQDMIDLSTIVPNGLSSFHVELTTKAGELERRIEDAGRTIR